MKKFLLVLGFTLLPAVVFAYDTSDTFCALGFDSDARMNGTWSYGDSDFNTNQWHSEDGSMIFQLSGDINDNNINVLVDGSYGTAYSQSSGVLNPGWSVGSEGFYPPGYFIEGDCVPYVPPPPVFGSTTVATSTLQLIGTNAIGFAILITIAFIYLIAYLYNSMFKKKPWRSS